MINFFMFEFLSIFLLVCMYVVIYPSLWLVKLINQLELAFLLSSAKGNVRWVLLKLVFIVITDMGHHLLRWVNTAKIKLIRWQAWLELLGRALTHITTRLFLCHALSKHHAAILFFIGLQYCAGASFNHVELFEVDVDVLQEVFREDDLLNLFLERAKVGLAAPMVHLIFFWSGKFTELSPGILVRRARPSLIVLVLWAN